MNQHLIDYTVRNITTGDDEDTRVLNLSDDDMPGFPDPVRAEIRELIIRNAAAYAGGNTLDTRTDWGTDSERIRQLLLPYISDRALYDSDYETWENHVLDVADDELAADDRAWAQQALSGPALDIYPPEHIATRVRAILVDAVDAAIENWSEGAWDEFLVTTPVRDILAQFAGYIAAVTDTEDDYDLNRPFMDEP